MQHEQTGLPETSYAETSFGGGNVTTEEIQRRLAALRNPTTGLLDTTAVEIQNQILSEEDKQKEIRRVKAFIKKRYPKADFAKLIIKFPGKKKNEWILLPLALRVVKLR